jgi:hypothetical protein
MKAKGYGARRKRTPRPFAADISSVPNPEKQ